MVERGDGFDYVFSDLTDIPLSSSETQSAEWQFLSNVLTKSLRLLRRGGRFLTHGSGVSSVRSLDNFEAHLKNLSDPVRVEYRRYNAFVPSFMEDWVFYQVANCFFSPQRALQASFYDTFTLVRFCSIVDITDLIHGILKNKMRNKNKND